MRSISNAAAKQTPIKSSSYLFLFVKQASQ
jgi:hypothetical protein